MLSQTDGRRSLRIRLAQKLIRLPAQVSPWCSVCIVIKFHRRLTSTCTFVPVLTKANVCVFGSEKRAEV